MDLPNFDSHSKISGFEKLKEHLDKNYTKFIKSNKNKADSASNNVDTYQFVKLLYNYIRSKKDFYESNF